jgi:outer membrane protein assembly factor BamB
VIPANNVTPGNATIAGSSISGNYLYLPNGSWGDTDIDQVNLTTGQTIQIADYEGDEIDDVVGVGNTLYLTSYQHFQVETLIQGDDGTWYYGPNYTNSTFQGEAGFDTLSPDGSTLYVDDWGDGHIAKVDLATGDTTEDFINLNAVIPNYPGPFIGALNVLDNNLFVQADDGNTYEFDATTGDLIQELTGGIPHGQSSDVIGDITTDPIYDPTPGPPVVGPPQPIRQGLPPAATPEPSSWVFAGLVLGMTGLLVRRARKASTLG